jgi:hypothetical protein
MSPLVRELLKIAGVIAAVVSMIFVIAWRRRTFRAHLDETADQEICEHLRPALVHLKSKGHRIVDVGQKQAEYPVEIHLAPSFDPAALARELDLQPPVFVSDRNVIYCKEDWCELHPRS